MAHVSELSAQREAQARGAAYLLLADLLARGPVEDLLDATRTSDVLASALDAYPTLDDAHADHQDAFGFNVPPLMGAFLDPEGHAGGESASRVAQTYAAIGYAFDPRKEEPEHLSTVLRALGVLAGAEADAMEDDEERIVAETRRLQAEVLRDHVLPWLPLFVGAVERLETTWPRALVHVLESLVELHRTHVMHYLRDEEPWVLEAPAIDLDDRQTDLRAIAHALAVPARCGIWLSKDDLKRVGRAHRLPSGFASRALMIQNLLRSAIRFEALDELVDDLIAILDSQRERLEPGHPAIARLKQTRDVLHRIVAEQP